MASVPVTVLLYNRSLLCGFNVTIKGLNLAGLSAPSNAARGQVCLPDTFNIVQTHVGSSRSELYPQFVQCSQPTFRKFYSAKNDCYDASDLVGDVSFYVTIFGDYGMKNFYQMNKKLCYRREAARCFVSLCT